MPTSSRLSRSAAKAARIRCRRAPGGRIFLRKAPSFCFNRQRPKPDPERGPPGGSGTASGTDSRTPAMCSKGSALGHAQKGERVAVMIDAVLVKAFGTEAETVAPLLLGFLIVRRLRIRGERGFHLLCHVMTVRGSRPIRHCRCRTCDERGTKNRGACRQFQITHELLLGVEPATHRHVAHRISR